MNRWAGLWAAVVPVVWLAGCNRAPERPVAVEQHVPEVTSVRFDLEPFKSTDGQQWIGIYNASGKTARFRMDFGPAEMTPGKAAGDPAVKSGEGTMFPEAGSDSSVLLADLQKALRATTAPTAPANKTSIPFTYIYVGEKLSQGSDGGFTATPAGDWTAMKLIFGDGPRECEILLHLNTTTRKGQFSMKEARFGDLALAELAKVF